MTHDEALDLLTDRLLDELSPGERERLESHLGECETCREAARLRSSAWETLGASEAPQVAPGAEIRFGRRLERERTGADRVWLGRTPVLAAAAVVLLVVGGLAGRATVPQSPDPGPLAAEDVAVDAPRFLLLLRGDEPDRRRTAEELVREYSAWGGMLADAGALIDGDELETGSGRWVGPGTPADDPSTAISGYFLVMAPSYDSAQAIAQASPHVGYGGQVEVRRVVTGR